MSKSRLDSWNIADRIRKLMKDRKLSASDVAKRVNLKEATLRNILSGTNNPQLRTAIKISETFDVTLDWLCTEVEEEDREDG